MKKDATNLDRIEQFFEEALSEEELVDFEKDLEAETFREDALFYQTMLEVLEEKGTAARAAILADIDTTTIDPRLRATVVAQHKRLSKQQEENTKIRSIVSMRRLLALAASVLILVSVGTFWYANTAYSSSSLAFQSYLNADVPGTMSGGALENEIFQAALQSFWVDKDLEKAKQQFSSISSTSPKYPEAQYFLAHIHLQKKEFSESVARFQAVIRTANLPRYINRDTLAWDLLLARLGAGEDITTDLDRLIADSNSPLYQKAKEMKQKLNSFWRKLSVI